MSQVAEHSTRLIVNQPIYTTTLYWIMYKDIINNALRKD
jgi:hypothetical protein